MSEVFDIEKIVNHRKLSNGKMLYFVKWQGYDSSNNSWEPKEHFFSQKVIDDYHAELEKPTIKDDENEKENDRNDGQKRNYLLTCDLLLEEYINAENYEPKKVLNIYHLKDDEKSLVALLQFKNKKNGFVRAAWANKHCPELVINFYENRIYWRNKFTGEQVKCVYTANNA